MGNDSKLKQTEYRDLSLKMISLIGYYLTERAEAPSVSERELSGLFTVAKKNSLCSITAAALRKVGIKDEAFTLALAAAQRISVLYDHELEIISKRLTESGIRFLPVKGMWLKKLYPSAGLREMSDMDILFDRSCAEPVKQIMQSEGYNVHLYDYAYHDVYRKKPYFTIEMHRSLFDKVVFGTLAEYFDAMTEKWLSADSPISSVKPEDMYNYLVAHAYAHYASAGTGLRTLLDFHLLLERYKFSLDFHYIDKELERLNISAYEKSLRALSEKLFCPEQLPSHLQKELDVYIFSGVYGNLPRYVKNRIKRKTGEKTHWKLAYIANRLRVSDRHIRRSVFYPKHPLLARSVLITRPIKALVTKPRTVITELKEILRYKKN